MIYQPNHKGHSFQIRRGVLQGSMALFSLLINDLPATLPSSISCSLFSDDLVIWSSPWSLLRWRPHKGLCFDWSAGLSTSVFFSIQANTRYSFQWLPTKLTSYPIPIPTPTLFGVTFKCTLSFSKVFLLSKFLFCLMAFCYISASSYGPSKEFLSLLYKAFLCSSSHLCFTRMVFIS